MSLVFDGGVRQGRISLNRWVELTSTSPAKIFGLFPRKGTIAPGSDADIVIFNPDKTTTLSVKTLHMKVDYNPYEGRDGAGRQRDRDLARQGDRREREVRRPRRRRDVSRSGTPAQLKGDIGSH